MKIICQSGPTRSSDLAQGSGCSLPDILAGQQKAAPCFVTQPPAGLVLSAKTSVEEHRPRKPWQKVVICSGDELLHKKWRNAAVALHNLPNREMAKMHQGRNCLRSNATAQGTKKQCPKSILHCHPWKACRLLPGAIPARQHSGGPQGSGEAAAGHVG